jgi:hypothetical protein
MANSDRMAKAFVEENGYLFERWRIHYTDGEDHFREDMLIAIGEYVERFSPIKPAPENLPDFVELVYREVKRIYPYSRWVKNPAPPLSRDVLDWIQGRAREREQKCDHEGIKKELEELGGMIAFTYCLVCRKRIAYKGRRIDPERCATEQTWSCRRCEYSEIISIPYFSVIGPTPYCPGCGADFTLIAEVERVVYQSRR